MDKRYVLNSMVKKILFRVQFVEILIKIKASDKETNNDKTC